MIFELKLFLFMCVLLQSKIIDYEKDAGGIP
jgi:hypothetical protein